MILAPGTSHATELVRIVDLRTIALRKGSLSVESPHDKIIITTLKKIVLNIVSLPNEFLHALQIGVGVELRAQEQSALSSINEYPVNNEQIFTKKNKP